MPKMKKLLIGALNIKIHPHSPTKYVELFKDTYRLAASAQIRGADYGTIGWLTDVVEGKPEYGMNGELYKFLNIDPHDPWFDQRTRQIVEIDEESDELPVPEHLKPNLKKLYYVFYPHKHRFFFDAKNFSPNHARKMLSGLFGHPDIAKKYGQVDIEIESSTEAIDKILSIPAKTRLEIRISIPNGDDTSSEEQRVIDRLRRQNARTITETYTALKEVGLEPDEDTITLMRVAKSNGYIKASGYGEDEKKIEHSTESHPLLTPTYYNPDTTSGREAMLSMSAELLASIARI